MFDIFCVGDNPVIKELPFVKKINHESEAKSLTKMYWVIEPNVTITDLNVFDYRPDDYDSSYEHVWKWNSNNYGGVKLIPKKEPQGIKEHDLVVCEKSFDVITDSNPNKYFVKHPYATHVWCVDPDYILPDKITWAPDNFEPDFIHVFHVAGQLEHKYTDKNGGVKLYPRKHKKNTPIKYHGYLDVDVSFPVIRTSTPNDYDVSCDSDFVWLVDDRLEIDSSELQWVPNIFQRDMVHNFHIPGQLEYEYPEDQGPVSLVPVGVENPDIVYHGEFSVRYKVLRVTDPTDFSQRDHITDEFVWLVDERYDLEVTQLSFIPSVYDRTMVHNFHLKHQLEHLYPESMGGVYLVPRHWQNAELKIVGVIDGVRYPVIYTHDVEAFDLASQYVEDHEYVWIIDKHYKINPESLNWTPSIFDQQKIHNFKMPNQLHHKYTQEMGGIYLVPTDNQDVELKIHKTCPIEDEIYEVYRVDHSELTQEKFTELAKQSPTEWFWVIDQDYEFNGKLRYVPHYHESQYIQVFKWGMEYRYLPKVTELWDNRVAGIYLVNKDFDWDQKKLHTDIVPVDYDIFYVDDVNDVRNYQKYSRQSRTEAFWLVDSEHYLPEGLNWVPPLSESTFINVFKVPGQLEHKYPKGIVNVSDNRCGGAKLIPVNYDLDQVKFQGILKIENIREFDKFNNLSDALKYSTTEWFWVIDPDVEVVEDFDWNFLPDSWDAGKTHVWQIKNPVTGLNYDYGGVSLHARNPVQGRDKYIKVTGSVKKPMDILYLDNKRDIMEQLHNFTSTTYMYYVVDPDVQFSHDYKFDVFPTQWDADCVHVFKNADGEYRNIRLVPKGFKFDSVDQLTNNSYEKLKEHDIVASSKGTWPVYQLSSLDAGEFHKLRKSTKASWFYTIDPGTDCLDTDWSYQPDVNDVEKVHIWQRLNPCTSQVHSYGGIRLWPTAHSENITTNSLKFNKNIPLRYIREPKSKYQKMDVLYLNSDTDVLEQLNSYKSSTYMYYVVDPNVKLHPDFEFDYYPTQWDTECVHVFKNDSSDYRNVRLVPQGFQFESLDQITHNSFPILKEMDIVASVNTDWPVYELTELTDTEFHAIRSEVTTDWFYTIDPDSQATDSFWNHQPDVNDFDRVHVWQRTNPVTSEVLGHGGIRLWPTKHSNNVTTEQLKFNNMENPKLLDISRAQYKTLDVLYLNNDTDVLEQLNNYESFTYMYYVVDPNVQLHSDFKFDHYPAPWDSDCVHIFQNNNLEYRNVRLVPNGYKFESLEQIAHNSFDTLKYMNIVASVNTQWPVYHLETLDVTEFESIRDKTETAWFYTIDPGTECLDTDWSFQPDVKDYDKIHVWQRLNPQTDQVHSYGGVRLWPTKHSENITSEILEFNKTKSVRYIKQPKSKYQVMDVLYLTDESDIVEQLNTYQSSTYMYYVVDPHVKLHPEFNFEYYPTPWDKDVVHLFRNTDGAHKNVRLVPQGFQFESLDQITHNSYESLKKLDTFASVNREWPVYELTDLTATEFHAIRSQVTEPWFFTIDPHTQPLTDVWDCEPDVNDFDRVHVWQRLNPHTNQVHGYGGIRLWPTDHSEHITTDALVYNRIPRLRYVRQPRSAYKSYPVILLSYQEERAQTAFDALESRSDNVLWVKDVAGIFNAHKEAAKLAGDSKMFWVVDADAELSDDFDFSYIPDVYDQETVHVWTTINPVTGSKYGYGGVKLFNTAQVSEATSWGLDFTTGLSSKFKAMPEVCGTTRFNTSAYDTWRSAFREVVKLTVSSDPEAEYRIREWLNPDADADFAEHALSGAKQAQEFAKQNINNQTELAKINDFEWLRKMFDAE